MDKRKILEYCLVLALSNIIAFWVAHTYFGVQFVPWKAAVAVGISIPVWYLLDTKFIRTKANGHQCPASGG